MKFKTLVALFFIAIIVIFSVQNTENTNVRFLKWDLSASRVVIFLGSFCIGVIVGMLVSISKRKAPKNK